MSTESVILPLSQQTLMDTELRLGKPYLYKHGAGGCEHFVVFSDIRMLHASDELDLTRYPRAILTAKILVPSCMICNARST